LYNQNTREEVTATIEIPAVAAGQFVDFTLPVETKGKVGLNDMEVFVNNGGELEQYFNNNVIRLEGFFNVLRDETNPAIDVTFDGVNILDGDIVSPRPLVALELRDNNQFLLKTDTLGVEIMLGSACDGCQLQRINFSDPNVTFTPATENSNYRVQFQPDGLEDGVYSLQVEATDASGNQSGIGPYTITFEVINESTVTNFYPYPNPFSSSTRFVFTLTGSEVPDQVTIQIFTVSGKVVREITQDELGPIRIGNNITDYAWDGKDEFGDQLANGVYLYRVKLKANGQDLGARATKGDRGFNKLGFGKLTILR
jgi:flagellar hook assembly protein FlgD